jgi:hypothetical protein
VLRAGDQIRPRLAPGIAHKPPTSWDGLEARIIRKIVRFDLTGQNLGFINALLEASRLVSCRNTKYFADSAGGNQVDQHPSRSHCLAGTVFAALSGFLIHSRLFQIARLPAQAQVAAIDRMAHRGRLRRPANS